MELREPESDDSERIRELIESTVTASYALSPQQIEAFLEEEFSEKRLTEAFKDSHSIVFVAESSIDGEETTAGGIVEAVSDKSEGEIRWLFVDPEHRGKGIGTQLFETVVEMLHQEGVEEVMATTLEANREGEQFFERFGFEQMDDRQIELAGESLVEYVYSESPTESEPVSEPEAKAGSDAELPNTETEDGIVTATTEDGQQVYLDQVEEESGTEESFLVAYIDEEQTEQFGYYCTNCGSLDTSMDNMGRIECSECSNTHAERSDEAYDDSHL
jgi:GNAT superfamily N-acetyltransferase